MRQLHRIAGILSLIVATSPVAAELNMIDLLSAPQRLTANTGCELQGLSANGLTGCGTEFFVPTNDVLARVCGVGVSTATMRDAFAQTQTRFPDFEQGWATAMQLAAVSGYNRADVIVRSQMVPPSPELLDQIKVQYGVGTNLIVNPTHFGVVERGTINVSNVIELYNPDSSDQFFILDALLPELTSASLNVIKPIQDFGRADENYILPGGTVVPHICAYRDGNAASPTALFDAALDDIDNAPFLRKSMFSSAVKIFDVTGTSQLGSGVMIHPRIILTAFHVVEDHVVKDATGFRIHTGLNTGTENLQSPTLHEKNIMRIGGYDLAIIVFEDDLITEPSEALLPRIVHSDFGENRDFLSDIEIMGAGHGENIIPRDSALDIVGLFDRKMRRFGRLYRPLDCNGCATGEHRFYPLPIVGELQVAGVCEDDSGSGAYVQAKDENGQLVGNNQLAIIGIGVSSVASSETPACQGAVNFADLMDPDVQEALRAELEAKSGLTDIEIAQLFVMPEDLLKLGDFP